MSRSRIGRFVILATLIGCSRVAPSGSEAQPVGPESSKARPEPTATSASAVKGKRPPEATDKEFTKIDVAPPAADKDRQAPRPTEPALKEDPLQNGKKLSEWIATLKSGDEFASLDALAAIQQLGPRAVAAEAAVPALVKYLQLNKDNPTVCGETIRAVGRIGRNGKVAVPPLLAILKGPDDSYRDVAAQALGGFTTDADMVVPALIAALGEADTRRAAAEALGGFGTKAKAAIPKLIELAKDTSAGDEVRAACRRALKQIDPAAAKNAGIL